MAYEIPKVKPDGTLTDYGKSLQEREATDLEASRIMSTYKPPKEIEYVNGVYKNYEDYVANSMGNTMGRDRFTQFQQERQQQALNDRQNEHEGMSNNQGGAIGVVQPQYNQGVVRPQQTSIQQLQQQIADAQRKNEIANLEQLYQKNVGGLTAERSKVDPLYAGQTRQAIAQGEMRKKSFSDFLAEKGLSASGQASQGEIAQNVAMQGQLGEIEGRRGEALSDIERRLTEATQARDFGIAGANTAADRYLAEQQLSGALRQQELDRADQLRREDIAREESRYAQETARADQLRQQAIQREDQLRQQGYSREDAQNQAELERRQKEQAMQTEIGTIDRYSNDFAAEIKRRAENTDPNDDYLIPFLDEARVNKIKGIKQSEAEQTQANKTAQQKFAEAQYDRAMEIWKTSGVANDYVAQILGVPKGSRTSDNAYKQAQLALDKIRASKPSTGTANQMKISYSSALSQARQILGNNANAQQIDALARQLVSGTPLTNENTPNLPKVTPPTTNKATDVLKYLGKLEASRDLTTINAFLNNNEAEFDRILKNPNSTDSEIEAVREIRRRFAKYK